MMRALLFVLAIAAAGAAAPAPQYPWHPYEGRWTFVRIQFNDGRGGDIRSFGRRGGFDNPGWRHDYPNAERNFSKILHEVTTCAG